MIIGFTGKKQSGKTEASMCLNGFKLLNFKDALINEIRSGFPKLLEEICRAEAQLNLDWYNVDKLFKKKPPLMRALMQNYGTDVRRKDEENYWTDRWLDRVRYMDTNIVVDDVRFINEAEAVRLVDGIIIRIERPGLTNQDTHVSELEMDEIEADITIVNDGTIEELCEKVNGING